jgi:hypothetical protein
MGANPYCYFTPYQDDVQAALTALREREFKDGRYDPAMETADPPAYMFEFSFPLDDSVPTPGAQHASIDEALDAAAESGTGSILDLYRISNEPDGSAASPLSDDDLVGLFGTTEPTREVVDSVLIKGEAKFERDPFEDFWDQIERGQGRYIIVFAGSAPREIFFAGYSWD